MSIQFMENSIYFKKEEEGTEILVHETKIETPHR
jgi:hypothetical protein